MATHNPAEVHNLVPQASTAYGAPPPTYPYPQPYAQAQGYPRTAEFYDPPTAPQASAYAGHGYAPQPYQPQQEGYEMNQRPAAAASVV